MPRWSSSVERIVSGGQTGADRAALDVALELGIPHGGWVPLGRRAEDGVVPARYDGVRETGSASYAARTEQNVRDSDATLLISHGELTGGSALTVEQAGMLGKPWLHLDLTATEDAEQRLREWLADVRPAVLNVAGPRASKDAAIHDATRRLLVAVLSDD